MSKVIPETIPAH